MAVRKLMDQAGCEGSSITFIATAAIVVSDVKKYPGGLFLKLDTDPNNAVVTGAGDAPLMVCRQNVAAGAKGAGRCDVGHLGLITLGGTVTLDADGTALVKADAAGKAVAATTGANVGGTVLKAGVVNDVVPLLFRVGRPIAA